MVTAILLAVMVFALVDSTSFGTLAIPLVLIVAAKHIHVRPLALYFGTVVFFYFLVGLALLLGLDAVFTALGDSLDAEHIPFVQIQCITNRDGYGDLPLARYLGGLNDHCRNTPY